MYPSFAQTAKEEGFTVVARTFEMIAAIEQIHGDRFGQLAERAEAAALFRSDTQTVWMCLNCGHVHTGLQAPGACPVCKHAQGYFVRMDAAEILPVKR